MEDESLEFVALRRWLADSFNHQTLYYRGSKTVQKRVKGGICSFGMWPHSLKSYVLFPRKLKSIIIIIIKERGLRGNPFLSEGQMNWFTSILAQGVQMKVMPDSLSIIVEV